MNKNYNFERKKLVLPEYGRHIQEMVDHLCAIEDREERNRQANRVIGVMGNINPVLRDSHDFNHKLWDHLFLMSCFELDVDSPYPIPTAITLRNKPQKLMYPRRKIAMKYYGKNIEKIIHSLIDVEDKAAVEAVINNLAKFMRTKSFEYNQDHPNNEIIIKDIKRMSDNKINLDEVAINNIKSEYKQAVPSYQKVGHKGLKINKNAKSGKIYRKRPIA